MSIQIPNDAVDFTANAVVNGQITDFTLSSHKGKWVVLFFYPLDFTFVCPTELLAFSEAADKFKAINTELVAVSVDSEYTHLAWTKTAKNEGGVGTLSYPLVADISKNIARDYGVLFNDSIALRGLFVIDPNFKVRHITINDLPVGRNVDEVLRVVKAFQFVEEHGEVCPANWNSGDKTMKPDPDGSKEYFESL